MKTDDCQNHELCLMVGKLIVNIKRTTATKEKPMRH